MALKSGYAETLAAILMASPELAKAVGSDKTCPGWAREIATAALFPFLPLREQKGSKMKQLFALMKSDNMYVGLTAVGSYGKLPKTLRDSHLKEFAGALLHHHRIATSNAGTQQAQPVWQCRSIEHRREGQWKDLSGVDQATFEMKWLKASLRSGECVRHLRVPLKDT